MKLPPLATSIAATAFASLLAFGPSALADDPIRPSAAATTSAPPETIAPPVNTTEGFMIINGVACTVHEGKATPITHDLILRVSPNGTVTSFDGRAYMLPSGHLLTIEARFTRETMDPPVLGVAPTPTPTGNITSPAGVDAAPPVVTAPSPYVDGSAPVIVTPGSPNSALPGVTHRREHLETTPNNAPNTERAPAPTAPNAPQQSGTFAAPVNNTPGGFPSGAPHGK